MNIKLDENMPAALADVLAQSGHNVDTVPQEGMAGRVDEDVWEAAQAGGRFLITQDLDFSDIRRFRPGTHHGLLLVRLRNPGRRALLARVRAVFQDQDVAAWQGAFVVLTERKVRVRLPSRAHRGEWLGE